MEGEEGEIFAAVSGAQSAGDVAVEPFSGELLLWLLQQM